MINKEKQSRREALKMGVAAITVAGVATATSTALAQTKTPFAVKSTFIPIADSKDLFPVRRILLGLTLSYATCTVLYLCSCPCCCKPQFHHCGTNKGYFFLIFSKAT